MARSEARVHTSIWRNHDFAALPPEAQRMFLLVLSQPDMTLAGVVAYVPVRWAKLSATTSLGDVEDAIALLEERRFVVVDRDTGELWVRTFAKHDGVLRNQNLRQGMWNDFRSIYSDLIKAKFVAALEGQWVDEATEKGWLEGIPPMPPEGIPPMPVRLGKKGQVELHGSSTSTPTSTPTPSLGSARASPKRTPVENGKVPTAQQAMFQAVADACGWDTGQLTKDAAGRIGAAVKQLAELQATPDDVATKAVAYQRKYPDMPLTPQALTGNWASLNGHRRRPTQCPTCGDTDHYTAKERQTECPNYHIIETLNGPSTR